MANKDNALCANQLGQWVISASQEHGFKPADEQIFMQYTSWSSFKECDTYEIVDQIDS